MPDQPADIVAFPRTVDEIVAAVRLAHQHRVPITPRGQGTGNYGQAVPLARGIVLDLSRCDRVLEVGDGSIRAQAGATFVALQASAGRPARKSRCCPPRWAAPSAASWPAGRAASAPLSTAGSGTDSRSPWTSSPVRRDGGARTVRGAECLPYLHAYGVTGIIATATVRLVPARERVAVLASFARPAWAEAARSGLKLLHLNPPPRLVSLDEANLVAIYPTDEAMPAGRHSLRAIVDTVALESLRGIVSKHSGRVEAVRPKGAAYVASLSFNHVTLRARRADADLCHLQVSGEALITRADEVRAALPAAMLHLDGLRTHIDPIDPARGRNFGGLLVSSFHDAETLYAGIGRLEELGVHVLDPHSWLLGGPALPSIRTAAAANDPLGLLNPGKLPPTSH